MRLRNILMHVHSFTCLDLWKTDCWLPSPHHNFLSRHTETPLLSGLSWISQMSSKLRFQCYTYYFYLIKCIQNIVYIVVIFARTTHVCVRLPNPKPLEDNKEGYYLRNEEVSRNILYNSSVS